VNTMEKTGFEIHSVENVSTHYQLTIKKWHDNWLANKDEILKTYGERWYRIWHVFLAWATTIAGQGTAACFQIVSNKNLNHFDRSIWVGQASLGERMQLSARKGPVSPTLNNGGPAAAEQRNTNGKRPKLDGHDSDLNVSSV